MTAVIPTQVGIQTNVERNPITYRSFIASLVISLLFLCLGAGLDTCLAQTQTFTHTARVVMGSRETQGDCREFAKVEARRAVLDQVGVYIEGRSDLMQRARESATGLTDETDLQKRVLAIAAGVTQLEVAGEEWKSESGAAHYQGERG